MYTYCYINNTIRIIYQAKYFFDARSTLSCNRLVHGMRITAVYSCNDSLHSTRFATLDHVIIILFHLNLLNFSKEINKAKHKKFYKLCRAKHLNKQIKSAA